MMEKEKGLDPTQSVRLLIQQHKICNVLFIYVQATPMS